MEVSETEIVAVLSALGALAAWLARELAFKQHKRHQAKQLSIIVGDDDPTRPRHCLLDYIPTCAHYRPDPLAYRIEDGTKPEGRIYGKQPNDKEGL